MINYYEYHDMTEKMFFGVALTDEHLNNITLQIAKYISDGNAQPITDALGLCVIERKRDGRVWYRRICYRLTGQELTPKEIMNIGLFLPHGAYYGKCNVPTLEG